MPLQFISKSCGRYETNDRNNKRFDAFHCSSYLLN